MEIVYRKTPGGRYDRVPARFWRLRNSSIRNFHFRTFVWHCSILEVMVVAMTLCLELIRRAIGPDWCIYAFMLADFQFLILWFRFGSSGAPQAVIWCFSGLAHHDLGLYDLSKTMFHFLIFWFRFELIWRASDSDLCIWGFLSVVNFRLRRAMSGFWRSITSFKMFTFSYFPPFSENR